MPQPIDSQTDDSKTCMGPCVKPIERCSKNGAGRRHSRFDDCRRGSASCSPSVTVAEAASPSDLGPGFPDGRCAKSSAALKRCSKCSRTRPVADFYPNRSKRDGLESQCSPCVLKRKALARRANMRRQQTLEQFGSIEFEGVPDSRILIARLSSLIEEIV